MISVSNLTLYFGGQDVFSGISLAINKGDKIGLVGKNGAGKSTLLNLFASKITPNSGDVAIPNNLRIGYLTQDLDFNDELTVIDEAKTAFKEINTLQESIDTLNMEISDRKDFESDSYLALISQLHEKQEQFQMKGGNDLQSTISQVLLGLGFVQSDFIRDTNEFSGGWRMRIELAKILLQKPDVMLLDEPTNHLDIESIIWLESWLKKYKGALVLVSHDRLFLDSVTNSTVEIAFGKLNDYKAPYPKYIMLRQDRQEKQIQASLAELELSLSVEQFMDYLKQATIAREAVKLAFTHNLSLALDCIIEFGISIGVSREQIVYLTCHDLTQLKLGILNQHQLDEIIAASIKQDKLNKMFELPGFISKAVDFYCFEQYSAQANFITNKQVTAKIKILSADNTDNIAGHIILIRQADPGYDWLFSYNIAGLITQHGGANSHMAIKTAELGIPAAIGVGDKTYNKLVASHKVKLDCSNHNIMVIL